MTSLRVLVARQVVPPVSHLISVLSDVNICTNVTGFPEEWLAATRTGQCFGQTPIGYVSQWRPLRSDHPLLLGLRMTVIARTSPRLNLTRANLSDEESIAMPWCWMNDGKFGNDSDIAIIWHLCG